MSMTASVLTLPAPGWYPDPVGASVYRWWDGGGWTEGTHEGDAGAAAEPEFVIHEPAFAEPEPEPEPEPQPAFEPVVFESAVFEPAIITPRSTTVTPSPQARPFAPTQTAAPTAPATPTATEPAAQPSVQAPVTTASTPVRRGVSPAKTRWSTILTAYPFVYPFAVGVIVALAYAGGSSMNLSTLPIIGAGAAVVLLLPSFVIAEHDRKELIARGYEPAPSLAWLLLLPPIGYLIARRRVVGPSF